MKSTDIIVVQLTKDELNMIMLALGHSLGRAVKRRRTQGTFFPMSKTATANIDVANKLLAAYHVALKGNLALC
jgi:hypothetical protein